MDALTQVHVSTTLFFSPTKNLDRAKRSKSNSTRASGSCGSSDVGGGGWCWLWWVGGGGCGWWWLWWWWWWLVVVVVVVVAAVQQSWLWQQWLLW